MRSSRLVGILMGFVMAVAVNLAPWWLSPMHADGFQTIGFPLAAYGRGGHGWMSFFDWKAAMVDAVAAVAITWCVSKLVQFGPRRCWTKLRTWGTPLEDG